MTQSIWKFPIAILYYQEIEFPKGAQILSVQEQYGEVCLWAKVDKEAQVEMREIIVLGTGHLIPGDTNDHYIGTVQQAGGRLVWHVFERLKGKMNKEKK